MGGGALKSHVKVGFRRLEENRVPCSAFLVTQMVPGKLLNLFSHNLSKNEDNKKLSVWSLSKLLQDLSQRHLKKCLWKIQICLLVKFRKFVSFALQIDYIMQKQPQKVFYKKCVLKNFTKFTEKRLCQSLFFNKVAGLGPVTLWITRNCYWDIDSNL